MRIPTVVGAMLMMFLALAISAPAYSLSVATVNMKRVMAEAKAAKSAKSQLEAKQKEFQQEVRRTEKKLQKKDQDLAKQRSLLSSDSFKEKLSSFRGEAARAQKDVQAKRQKLRRAFEKSILRIQRKTSEVIAAIAREKGYDLVLPTAQTLHHDAALDITPQVLERLDAELPNLVVEFKVGE